MTANELTGEPLPAGVEAVLAARGEQAVAGGEPGAQPLQVVSS